MLTSSSFSGKFSLKQGTEKKKRLIEIIENSYVIINSKKMILFELYLYTLSISFEHDNPMICSLMSLKLGKARNCILSSNDSSSFTYLQRHNFTRWYRSQSLSDKDLLVAKNLWDEQYQMMIYVCIDSNNIFRILNGHGF